MPIIKGLNMIVIKKIQVVILFCVFGISFLEVSAQEKLYTNEFPLENVSLLDGKFKNARDLNMSVLLEYDVDRLLAPYRKEAGLEPRNPPPSPRTPETFSIYQTAAPKQRDVGFY